MTIFLIALLLRAGWGTFRLARAGDPSALEFPDEEQYWLMAVSVSAGEGLQDELGFRATRMPLYPLGLSVLAATANGVVIAKVFHWVIGALAGALAAGTAAALFDRRVGLVAGLLTAFDPFLIFFSSLLLTETAFVAVLMALWWLIARIIQSDTESLGRWVAVGLAAVLCVYVRESSVGLVAVALGFTLVCRRFDRRTLLGTAIAAGLVVLALLPWAARNRHVVGEWCWLTTRAGISLYDGVGPQASGDSDLGNIKHMPAVRGLSELGWNRYFMGESVKAIKSEPGRVVTLAGKKLARMWNPFPNVQTYQSPSVRAISAVWTMPTFILAVVGALLLALKGERQSVRTVVLLLLPALYLSALHSLFVGSIRYRLGAIPMIEILAAVALVVFVDRARRGSARRECVAGD